RGAGGVRRPPGGGPPGQHPRPLLPPRAVRRPPAAPPVPGPGRQWRSEMRIRAANIRDVGRIEQIYREGGEQMSEAVPPARLWSLLSHTLSALLPLAQETLLYVGEEEGRLLGFVQAAGEPLGISLTGARTLQVLNLCVAGGAEPAEVAVPLVEHLCGQALAKGVHRIFVRLPLDDALTPVFRMQGFRQYAT